MTNTIAGFFHTQTEGQTAFSDLLASGFTRDQVSLVMGDTRGHTLPAVGPVESTGAESEMPQDVALGSVIGLAAGLVALVIPGVGPLLAAGPLAAALGMLAAGGATAGGIIGTAAIGGLTVGAAAGGIIGLLRDHGVSEEEAAFYAEGVSRGGSLVTVRVATGEEEKKARKIMEAHGAVGTEDLAASTSKSA